VVERVADNNYRDTHYRVEADVIDKTFLEKDGVLVALVTFTMPSSTWAGEIHLVGDFNDWSPASHPFHCDRDGNWRITIELDCGRSYQFRYLLDRHDWINDGQADDYAPNPYGGVNCVLDTTPTPESSFRRVRYPL
jgi:1,4-alpha-glucan branching enzyme